MAAKARRPSKADRSSSAGKARREDHEAFDVFTWGAGGQGALANSAFRDELEPYLVSSLRAYGGTMCAPNANTRRILLRKLH